MSLLDARVLFMGLSAGSLLLTIITLIALLSLIRIERDRLKNRAMMTRSPTADYSAAISLLVPSPLLTVTVRRPRVKQKQVIESLSPPTLTENKPLQTTTKPAPPKQSVKDEEATAQRLLDYLKTELANRAV
jgi:hypothetical protein